MTMNNKHKIFYRALEFKICGISPLAVVLTACCVTAWCTAVIGTAWWINPRLLVLAVPVAVLGAAKIVKEAQ